jgi:tRNA-specific adenosine deaminase 1
MNYHCVGSLRTKPGRGDPTQSMSCSDKIAKWLVLGAQGTLLSLLISQPIYFGYIVVSKLEFTLEILYLIVLKEKNNKINCK